MRVTDVFTRGRGPQAALERARIDLAAFMDASLVMVNEAQLHGPAARIGLCLYAWGAARSLARHHRLARDARRTLVRETLQAMAQRYPVVCPSPECTGPARRAALAEGRTVAGDWLLGENDAPLRCAQLLSEWRAGGE